MSDFGEMNERVVTYLKREIDRRTDHLVVTTAQVIEASRQAVAAQANLKDLSGPVHRIKMALAKLDAPPPITNLI